MDTLPAIPPPLLFSPRPGTITTADLKAAIESGQEASWINVKVTPALAKVMLQYNTARETNRRLSPRHVKKQSEAISEGRWTNTGEPIIFSSAQLLNDGQHRLEGVVASGKTAVMDIRFGVDRRAFLSTNTGKPRSAADTLMIAGHSSSSMTGAICRLIRGYLVGMPIGAYASVDNRTVVEMVEQDPRIEEAVTLNSVGPRLVRNATTATIYYFGLCVGNRSSVEEFAHVLRTGDGAMTNPPHRLREALLARGTKGHTTQGRVANLAMGIQAWNAWHTGKPIGRFWKPSDSGYPSVIGLKTPWG